MKEQAQLIGKRSSPVREREEARGGKSYRTASECDNWVKPLPLLKLAFVELGRGNHWTSSSEEEGNTEGEEHRKRSITMKEKSLS